MKTVLITGAGSGIGKATAKLFAEKGYFVGLYDINEEAVKNVALEIGESSCCYSACDVADFQQVQAMIQHFGSRTYNAMDILVNCAGVLIGNEFASLNHEMIDKMIDVNCKGLTYVAHESVPLLRRGSNPCIVNIGSVSGIYGAPGLPVYSATKFYVRGLTEALRIELKSQGIRVTSVMPPLVNTPLIAPIQQKTIDRLGIELVPKDIAISIEEAASGKSVHHLVNFKGLFMMEFLMVLPAKAREWIIAKATGYS